MNAFVGAILGNIFLNDSLNRFDKAQDYENKYLELSINKSIEYLSYKIMQDEYINQLDLKDISLEKFLINIDINRYLTTALEESFLIKSKYKKLSPENDRFVGFLFSDGTTSPILCRHYKFERHVVTKLGYNPNFITYNVNLLPSLTGAIKVCHEDVTIFTKPTVQQIRWLIKYNAKKYHVNNQLFQDISSTELDTEIKKLPYSPIKFSLHRQAY
jgi:hypothetical protein